MRGILRLLIVSAITIPLMLASANAQSCQRKAPPTENSCGGCAKSACSQKPECPAKKKDTCKCDCKEKDPSAWEKSVALGFSMTDGNSNTSLFNVAGKIARDYNGEIWRFEASSSYGRADSKDSDEKQTTQHDVKALAEYKYLFTDRAYAGLGAGYLLDRIAEVDYRATINPALGYFFLKDDQFKLSAEAGPSYLFEKVDEIEDDYLAPRVAERFEWAISETSGIFQSAEALFDAESSDNYIINSEAGIKAAISSDLSLALLVKNTFDNEPAAGKERSDTAVLTSLIINL